MKSVKKALVFNDIVGSSKLWKKHPKLMFKKVQELIKLIKKYSEKNNGQIVKMIGDSFMVSFNKFEDAIDFALDFVYYLNDNPMKLAKGEFITFRTGICYGKVNKFQYNVQDCAMTDYFGNVVNTASRMESKVSHPGGFAVGVLHNNKKDIPKIIKLLKEHDEYFDIKVRKYGKCNVQSLNRFKRSTKLLHDVSFRCESLEQLHGVDKVYSINAIPLE